MVTCDKSVKGERKNGTTGNAIVKPEIAIESKLTLDIFAHRWMLLFGEGNLQNCGEHENMI